jgi:hypothetical protein
MQTIAAPTICMVMNGGPGTDNHEQDYPEHEGAYHRIKARKVLCF